MLTLLFGLVLIVVGVLFKTVSDSPSWTPMIPAAFGVLLIACAAAAMKKAWRMHAMHAAVLLTVLLVLGSIMPLMNPTTEKVVEAVLTIVLGVVYIVMCVRSFFAARRARKIEKLQQE